MRCERLVSDIMRGPSMYVDMSSSLGEWEKDKAASAELIAAVAVDGETYLQYGRHVSILYLYIGFFDIRTGRLTKNSPRDFQVAPWPLGLDASRV
jgi:hypothetical protein